MIEKLEADDESQHIEGAYTQTCVESENNVKDIPVRQDEEWIKAQKRYLRKLDGILLPAVSILYFFEYLDRGNIANAKLYGLDSGHKSKTQGAGVGTKSLNPSQWQLVVMIFYVGLVLFQVPGCIGYRVFSPSKVRMSRRLVAKQNLLIIFTVDCLWCLWMGYRQSPSVHRLQLGRGTRLQNFHRYV